MNKKNNVAHLLYFRIIAQKENYISFLMNEYKFTEEQAEKSLKKFLRTCKSKMFLYNNKYELQDDKEEYYLVDKKTKEKTSPALVDNHHFDYLLFNFFRLIPQTVRSSFKFISHACQ